jgi:dolichyl-phosphate-mannose-protein mannosyltransferase
MDRKADLRWLWIGLSFVWMAFVYASFYLVQQQRPFGGANLKAVGSVLLDGVAAVAVLLAAAAWGHRLCRWMGIAFEHDAEALLWGTGLGLGAVALGMLGLGLLGWLTRWATVLLLAILVLLSWASLPAVGRALASLRSVRLPRWGLRVYLLGMLILTLLVALAPPTSWDGLFYHLTVPRLYIEQGRIAPVTDMPHQHFPGLMEMLYLALMLIRGDAAATLIHFAFLCLLGAAVYRLAQRHLQPGLGWKAVTVYAAMPMVFVLGAWAYNDLALAFYQIAALYALLVWLEDGSARWLGISAAFCGLAMGLKYTSFICPLIVALIVCWRLARARADGGRWLRALSLFCGVSLLVAAPWYLRNLAFTGNPVYPFAYRLFGGAGWDAWRAAWYARGGTGLGWDLAALVRLPWVLTLGLRDMNFYDGRIGPLFLLALPFLIAWGVRLFGRTGSHPQAMGYLVVFAVAQYVFWVLGVVHSRSLFQSRLLLPACAALCAPLAYLYEELRSLDTRVFSLRRLIGMSVALVLAANLCYQFIYTVQNHPVAVLAGVESRAAYLRRNLGAHYAAMEVVNDRVPGDGRVLFLWEPRSYYCERDAQPDPILERWAWLRHRYGDDLGAIARALDGEGYTHVLLHRAGLVLVLQAQLDPVSSADVEALEAFRRAFLREEAAVGGSYELYQLWVE